MESTYKCPFCGKSITDKTTYYSHVEDCTKKSVAEVDKKTVEAIKKKEESERLTKEKSSREAIIKEMYKRLTDEINKYNSDYKNEQIEVNIRKYNVGSWNDIFDWIHF